MMADNLWRGGLLAHVDCESGTVGRVRRGLGPAAGWVETHPDTGVRLTGMTLPHWPRLVEQVIRAAGLLSGLPLVGWDVAVGPDGPVFIEANTSPSLELLQYASGAPALPPALRREFLDEAARLRRQARDDLADRNRRLRDRIRGRLAQSLGFGRSRD